MRILGISGSLRAASHNSALLRAATRLAPGNLEVLLYRELGTLPLFNPDLEDPLPPPVAALREQLLACDAVVIASPEYAHGVTGSLKNALDWMVGNESFVHKPVAVWNAAPRSSIAQASLREILRTMSARVIEEASLSVPLLGSSMNEDTIVASPEIGTAIQSALRRLAACATSP